jgi:uncharacterized membrane protein YuzA (DUF378 family)
MQTLIGVAVLAVIAALLAFGENLRRRHLVYIAVGLVALGVLYPLLRETMEADGQVWHAATFLGSILLTIGWIVTSETTIRNARRQHTITLITQHAFDPKRAENRDVIKKYLPTYQTRLTRDLVDFSDEKHELLKAIDLELNFYEFLAIGAHRDDVDDAFLRESLYGQFSNFYRQNTDYIRHWQGIGSGSTWSHLSRMYVRWSQKPPPIP